MEQREDFYVLLENSFGKLPLYLRADVYKNVLSVSKLNDYDFDIQFIKDGV
jgi:hypothetical protein